MEEEREKKLAASIQALSGNIGNVCVQWAMLEGMVAYCIWEMLGLKSEIGCIVTGGLDMLPRLNMAANLSRSLKLERSIEKVFVDVRKQIQKDLGRRRNQAVHGIHRDGSDETRVVFHMHRSNAPEKLREVDIDNVRELGTKLNNLWRTVENDAFKPLAVWRISVDRTRQMSLP